MWTDEQKPYLYEKLFWELYACPICGESVRNTCTYGRPNASHLHNGAMYEFIKVATSYPMEKEKKDERQRIHPKNV